HRSLRRRQSERNERTPSVPAHRTGATGLWISIGCQAIERALRCGMNWQTRSVDENARLITGAAECYAPGQEWPIMEAVFSQRRGALAFAAFAVGIALFWLTKTTLSLLAPLAALF